MWTNPQETADLVTFTEGILDGKLHFLFELQFAHRLALVLEYHGRYISKFDH